MNPASWLEAVGWWAGRVYAKGVYSRRQRRENTKAMIERFLDAAESGSTTRPAVADVATLAQAVKLPPRELEPLLAEMVRERRLYVQRYTWRYSRHPFEPTAPRRDP